MRFRKNHKQEEADLDITSFMNLMIILVPVLLLSMVFAQTTIVDLKLPELASDSAGDESEESLILEVLVRSDYLDVNYPAGTLLKRLPMVIAPVEDIEGIEEIETTDDTVDVQPVNPSESLMVHDYKLLSLVLQEVKRQLALKDIQKSDILLLSEPDTSYQTLISTMDAIRSYKALVVTDVVDAALFPDISLGDAPALPVEPDEQVSVSNDLNVRVSVQKLGEVF